ncbi:pyridoxal-phosphate dependent enzyme [Robertkochia solimangrovi]|uniref:pyridoxal-phosphate dependent enzyme n=1 Tax=Robertkochia solimangrovi TaxID=2213046 RepID=UPI00117C0A46|nr:pyridoxal-phosphate dependent enzyme [Robertkochia solimangrovi]TRZ42020.1 cystathionine beta-synthase [Robertkochia solimangrovi]
MKFFENIMGAVGHTPLVRLNHMCAAVNGTVLAKIEYLNPGNSIKDRIAVKMVGDAEKDGRLLPGGTIIEGTSGNTGMGLALAAVVKGYRMICVINDKQSKEKVDILRAVGAEVVVCPTSVAPEDPRSYYSVSKRLAEETPGSWYVNQYDNPSNSRAHYESTGPEIWEQTDGKIDHFITGVGTGGTISGVGKYLKEKNPNIRIWGVDSYGSVFKKYHETGIFDPDEIYPYITEGIGEDILPANVDFKIIDGFTKVTDRDAAVYTRRLAREEGILGGNSSGAVIRGIEQLSANFKEGEIIVAVIADSGTRYVGKMFNDSWMQDHGFISSEIRTVSDLLHSERELITVRTEELVYQAIDRMRHFDISQMPVKDAEGFAGSLDERTLLKAFIGNRDIGNLSVKELMQEPFPILPATATLETAARLINRKNKAVLVQLTGGAYDIITRHDIISAI